MKLKRLYAVAILLATAIPLGSFQRGLAEPTVASASPTNVTAPSLEELLTQRRNVRRELMLDSLKGIRGLGYGVIHADDTVTLNAMMQQKLKQLDISLYPFSALKPGVKPVDALLEIKVSKTPGANYVQINLFQWVSLIRPPKTEVRAVTYHDSLLSDDTDLDKSIAQLTDQFVIDFLRANQKSTITPKTKAPLHKKH
jgi:hypothetical protein